MPVCTSTIHVVFCKYSAPPFLPTKKLWHMQSQAGNKSKTYQPRVLPFLRRSLMLLAFYTLGGLSSIAQIGQKMKAASESDIQGTWRNSSMGFQLDLQLGAGGKGNFDGEPISYTYSGSQLIVKSSGVTTTYSCKLVGSQMTLSGGDLDAPVVFSKITGGSGGQSSPSASTQVPGTGPQASGEKGLIGTWVAANEEISFTTTGQFVYNGVPLAYTLQGNKILVNAPAGSIQFEYAIQGQQLTLKGEGLNAVYSRKGTAGNSGTGMPGPPSGDGQADASGGVIDPTLVGKWSYVGSGTSINSSFSNEEYITLHADGTYEYYSESSRSVSGSDMHGNQTYSGGTASQGADRGTWRVKGNTIIANSQRNGVKVYQLQKRNHPKNGDPMIVLDGTAYVTYYQKAPWR